MLSLLMAANEFMMTELKNLCERLAAKNLNLQNFGCLFLYSKAFSARELYAACEDYLNANYSRLKTVKAFREVCYV